MPIRGYFSKRKAELKIPRADEGRPDAEGFTWNGDILTGKLSVEQSFALEARCLANKITPGTNIPPEDYDPLLKHHLRID